MTLTLAMEIFGWFCVVGGGLLMFRGGLGIGGCGAVILGMAYAGAFNGF